MPVASGDENPEKVGRARPQWTALKVIHLLSVETAATATLFLTVFYWIALASGPVTADNVIKHGANNGVALGDVLLSRVPFVSYHFQVRFLLCPWCPAAVPRQATLALVTRLAMFCIGFRILVSPAGCDKKHIRSR